MLVCAEFSLADILVSSLVNGPGVSHLFLPFYVQKFFRVFFYSLEQDYEAQ